jgi:NADPH:quinone reductase-like Zn-dependent oxidoreductase
LNYFLPSFLGGVPRKYIWFSQDASARQIDKFVALVEEKKVNVVVERVFDLEETLDAFDFVASRSAKGKIIVKVGGEI